LAIYVDEKKHTANSMASPTPSRSTTCALDTQICEGCHETGHHYMECLNYTYIWDSTANAGLLASGKCLSGPATWEDIHQASLHQLIHTSIQHCIHLHHTHIQYLDTLLTDLGTNSEFGDLTQYINYEEPGAIATPAKIQIWEQASSGHTTGSEIPPSTSHPGIWLINLTVLTATTHLHVHPRNETQSFQQFIVLHHWHPS
jgi:hypothetical protein